MASRRLQFPELLKSGDKREGGVLDSVMMASYKLYAESTTMKRTIEHSNELGKTDDAVQMQERMKERNLSVDRRETIYVHMYV
jgi:hypothetical protein